MLPAPVAAMLVLASAPSVPVRVPGPAGTLAGTLTLPTLGHAPFPAVVTLTGSGAHYRDGNRTPGHPYQPFRQIAERLASCGVATLRLDDRGVGESEGNAGAATAQDTAADARAALTFLRARPEIDGRRVGLVGHSYGGLIAPLVAAADPAVAAVVLLGAPARTFRETMRYQHRYRIENDASVAPAARESALAEAMRQQEANVASSAEAWRRSIQDHDPLPDARRLGMPVLILQGLADRAVDPADASLLESAIRGSGNRHVERRLFPGVNHHFQRDPVGAREGYDLLPTQDLAPEVLDAVCAWLEPALLQPLDSARAPAREWSTMCRSIRTLFNFEPPATEEEVRAASLQFVRKLSGFNAPSRANEAAFERAVADVTKVAQRLVDGLVTTAPPRSREAVAAQARARYAKRFGGS